jgi:hypothetical protein
VEILLLKKLSLQTLQRVKGKRTVEILLAKEVVVTDIAEVIMERKIGNPASKRNCRY